MSVHDETWDRPLCNYCKESIRHGQKSLHSKGACLVTHYMEDGKMVLTRDFLLRRGKCCRRDCKNCPY